MHWVTSSDNEQLFRLIALYGITEHPKENSLNIEEDLE